MDNFRLVLFITLSFIVLLMYQAWLQDYGPKPQPAPPAQDLSQVPVAPNTTTASSAPEIDKITGTPDIPSAALPATQGQRVLESHSRVKIQTDVLALELDTLNGDVRQLDLSKYPVDLKEKDNLVRLMTDEMPHFFIAQSGILPGCGSPSSPMIYQAEQNSYQLAAGADKLQVVLNWQNDAGLKISKIYTMQRGSYVIDVQHKIENHSPDAWNGCIYALLQRTDVVEVGHNSMVYTYLGGAVSSPTHRYEKIQFSEVKDGKVTLDKRPGWQEGWLAMVQHYFFAAWLPESDKIFHYYTRLLSQGNRYVLGMYSEPQTIKAGGEQTFNLRLYTGPKLQNYLEGIATGLDLTVDYGWLWMIAKPLFWILEFIYKWVNNWGWAIIILTIMIKLAFFHLSATSYKSMAHMRRLQPRLESLKERYADDKAKLNQAVMDLYRHEKVNPLGGCLPILVQIPVFIALYWVLLESIELRQAPFILWIQDLSMPDPFFVLPLIMGATMLVQHFLNPAPIDPVQQKVMLVLPIVFTGFFAFFPAGLVLYWVVNNVLSIAQQWVITKKIAGNLSVSGHL
jgi:YidC/Oxa1 family membrane protein insertase